MSQDVQVSDIYASDVYGQQYRVGQIRTNPADSSGAFGVGGLGILLVPLMLISSCFHHGDHQPSSYVAPVSQSEMAQVPPATTHIQTAEEAAQERKIIRQLSLRAPALNRQFPVVPRARLVAR